jgi:Domain of unknown function (DUF927)/Primase C terminal 2 (PriCT-2)
MLHISFGKNVLDTVPVTRETTFSKFFQFIQGAPRHTGHLSWAEYALAGKLERGRAKDTRWFIPAFFVRPERRANAVGSLSGFVCDFDDGHIHRGDIEAYGRRAGCAYIAWTSFSNGLDGKEKYRVFIPYAAPLDPADHARVFDYFNEEFGGHLDPRCATLSQLWYLPGSPEGAPEWSVFGVDSEVYFDTRQAVSTARPTRRHAAKVGDQPDASIGGDPVGALSVLAARAADNAEIVARGPVSLRDIITALAALDKSKYEDYTEWLNIGMAIYDGTGGSEQGLRIFDKWSSTCPGYQSSGNTEAKWRSFGGREGLSRITVASLFKQALDIGWSPDDGGGTQQPLLHPAPVQVPGDQPVAGPRIHPAVLQPAILPVLVVPSPPPRNWRRHATEISMQREEDHPETGGRHWVTRIRETRLISIEMLEAIDGGPHGTCNLRFECADKTRNVQVELGLLGGSKESDLRAVLASCGIILGKDDFKCLQELIVEWLQKIKRENKVKKSVSHLGWLENEGQHVGFAAGSSAYYADGTSDQNIQIAASAGSLAAHYKPVGDITPWKAITAFLVGQKQPALLAILASGFASPLVKFSGVSGVVVSVISSASGVGKSSSLTAAQAIWGDPKGAIHAATDTPLSLSKKMGFTKNLPAYWDDIKGERTFEAFAELLFQITQGKEKARLNQQAELRTIETWDCLAVVAANDSIVEISRQYSRGSDAGISRIFEIRLEDRPATAVAATFFDGCRHNYGHAGAIYAKWLAENRPLAEAAVIRTTERLSKELSMQSEERFWIAAISTMVVGARLAKMLGLVDFDVLALETFLVARFHQLRGGKATATAEAGPERQVADLVYDYQATTLLVDTIPKFNKGKPLAIRHPKLSTVDIVLVKDDGLLRVRKSLFHSWCKSRGFSADTLRTKLEKVGAVKEKNVDPMAGCLPYSQGSRTACYDINLRTLNIQTGDADGDDAPA